MLYILLSLLLLIIVNSGLGNLYARLFRLDIESLSLKLLLSIMTTTIIWTILAFIFPLNYILEIIFSIIGISSFIYYKNYLSYWKFLIKRGPFFYVLIGLIIFSGSFYPFILDHFGYYVPTIEWLKNFGLVKGISNLDIIIGQTSFWHIYQSGFSHFIDIYFRINVFLLSVFVIYTFESRRWVLLTFVPILMLFTQSPSPDLPVLALSLIILNEILNHSKKSSFLFSLSVFIFCIKPTMIWLPLFTGIYYLVLKKRSLKLLIPGAVIFIIFTIKNLYLFGYPIFPIELFDINLAWKPHPGLLKISSEFGLTKTFDSQYSIDEIRNFSTFDYLYHWLTLDGIKSKINLAFIITLIAFGIFCIIKKRKVYTLLFLSILLKSIIVIIISAQYRFFIDVFLVFGFILLYKSWYAFGKISSLGLSVCVLILLSLPTILQQQIPSFNLGSMMSGFNKKQFLEPSHYEFKKFTSHQIGNLKFNTVKNYPFSFDTPVPAITSNLLSRYEKLGIFPQLIKDNDIKSGFIWKTLKKNDREKLKNIITELQIKGTD